MANRMAGRLTDAILELETDGIHTVTVYTDDDIYHEYRSDDIDERSDLIELDSLHWPAQNVQSMLETVSNLNPLGGDHEGSIHFYENVIYLHFPIDEREGIIVSLDQESDRCGEVYSACFAYISE